MLHFTVFSDLFPLGIVKKHGVAVTEVPPVAHQNNYQPTFRSLITTEVIHFIRLLLHVQVFCL